MKLDWNKKYTTIAVYAFLVIAASIVFYLGLSKLDIVFSGAGAVLAIFIPFVYAFSFAYILNPMLKWIEQNLLKFVDYKKPRPKLKRGLGIFITYLVTFVLIGVFLSVVIPKILQSVRALVDTITMAVSNLPHWINTLAPTQESSVWLSSQVDTVMQSLSDFLSRSAELLNRLIPFLSGFIVQITAGLSNIVLGVIVSIYMLLDKERFIAQFKKLLCAFFKKTRVDRMVEIAHISNQTFSGFIIGKLLDSLIIGILCFLGMSLFRMPYAVLVSVIVGTTNVIPYFGPFIGAIPSFFIILIVSPLKALGFLVFIFILQQFDGNILGPKILGKSTGISAFWVIFAILLGGGMFGFIGMFIGVPAFSVIYSLVRVLIDKRLEEKNLPVKTTDYASEKNPIL